MREKKWNKIIKTLHSIVLKQHCNYNSFHSSGKAFKKGVSFWEFLTSLSEATMLDEKILFAVSSQRCSIRLMSRFCDGHSSFSTSNSLIHVFMDLDSCNVAQSCWNRKGSSANSTLKLGPWHCPNQCAEALRVPSTGSKGPNPTQMPSDCQKVWFLMSSSGVLYTTASLVLQQSWMQLLGHGIPFPEALYALLLS